MMKPQLDLPPIPCVVSLLRPVPVLQAHSCLQVLQDSLAHYPQARQREQRDQLRGVLGQAPIGHLGVAELALDHLRRMLDFGTHPGLELFGLIEQGAPTSARLAQSAAFARAHGHLPLHVGRLKSFVSAFVDRIGKHYRLLAMQQVVALRDVVDVGGRANDAVHHTRVDVHANVRLHPTVQLVALLGLMHLRVTLAVFVLGRARCGDQGRIDHGAGLEHQTFLGQRGIDGHHDLKTQCMLFKQVAKTQHRALVGQPTNARVETSELAVKEYIVQGFFNGRLAQPEPLLNEVDAQHRLHRKRRTTCLASRRMRLHQRHQIRPRHHQVHLIKKFALARALGRQHKSGSGKALLFHTHLTSEHASWMTCADLQ
jgi:hypothetical protein